jgi:diguanylate cyclase (GGDEF)-like protein
MSLGIGTELALLDNIIINQKVAKDSLTGALNRQGLRTIFQSHYELALATSNSFILALCDLDNFKALNDTYGHVAGDRMLQLFVEVVKKNIRNSDVIVRYGGEEFVIMLPSIHQEKGFKVIEKIREEFGNAILEFNGEQVRTTVSIGMMEVEPHHAFEQGFIDDYIMQVDQKLYFAKGHGRNRVEL